MKIVVVIPGYNVASTVGQVVDDVLANGWIPLVVDDGSKDQTAEVSKQHGATVLVHTANQGKGKGLRDGFDRALADGAKLSWS